LNSLRIVLGKEPQVFAAHFDFSPNTVGQHRENQPAKESRSLSERNCFSITSAFSCRLEFPGCIPRSDRQ
jgi:hypothetical protein